MGKLSITKRNAGGEVVLEMRGIIDEDASFRPGDFGSGGRVTINLKGVTQINSCGVRDWVKWMRGAPESVRLAFEECPKVIVDQINMVEGFLPKSADVESFYVTYFCEKCDRADEVCLRRDQGYALPETPKCPRCGASTELDVIEGKYFGFLKSRR